VFALSDCANPEFRQQCDHRHENVSEQCENLNSTLAAIFEATVKAPFHTEDDRDEAVYPNNHATLYRWPNVAKFNNLYLHIQQLIFMFNNIYLPSTFYIYIQQYAFSFNFNQNSFFIQ